MCTQDGQFAEVGRMDGEDNLKLNKIIRVKNRCKSGQKFQPNKI